MTGAVYEYNIMSLTNTFKTMDYEKQLKERVILNEVYAKQAQLQQAQVSLAPHPPLCLWMLSNVSVPLILNVFVLIWLSCGKLVQP